MRALRLTEHGGPSVLNVETVERPEPGPDELSIEVAASGVNPVDTYFRDGSYTPRELPFTPGVDYAGTVIDTGAGVDGFAPGDRVFGTGIGNADYQGALAEYAIAPVDRTVHLPSSVDSIEAGAAGVVAITAWRALIDHGQLDPAESCFVHGGSGGVGHVAVQIANAVNAQVVATANPSYHETVADLGADAVLDYSRDDLAEAAVAENTGEFDVILDHRLDDYLQFDADIAAKHGRVVGIGENRPDPSFSNDGVARSKDVSYHFMSMFNTPDLRVPLRGVAHLLASGSLTIEIEKKYDLEGAGQAQEAVMDESFIGKLVIIP